MYKTQNEFFICQIMLYFIQIEGNIFLNKVIENVKFVERLVRNDNFQKGDLSITEVNLAC